MELEGGEVTTHAKIALRRELLAVRRAMSDSERAQASAVICARLREALSWDGLVMAYAPVRGEVDPLPFVGDLLAQGLEVAFPAVVAGRGLVARRVSDLAQLVPGTFGILEPSPERPEADPAEIGLVLVPAVAYDRRGFRLGYGGGYYDRFLPLLRPGAVTVGLAYERLLVDALPTEAHDRPVRWVVTEMRLLGPLDGKEG